MTQLPQPPNFNQTVTVKFNNGETMVVSITELGEYVLSTCKDLTLIPEILKESCAVRGSTLYILN